jgi:iron complex outermembrane receptor protein
MLDRTAPVSVAQVTATPQPSSNDAGMLAEALATAQRRSESNENVPISVEAFSADQLTSTGVSNIADLATGTPGLVMGSRGGYLTAVNLRRHV